jgi:hypothetical protein
MYRRKYHFTLFIPFIVYKIMTFDASTKGR